MAVNRSRYKSLMDPLVQRLIIHNRGTYIEIHCVYSIFGKQKTTSLDKLSKN